MSEPRLSSQHLAAPRKLILLVQRRKEGGFQAVTLTGAVALLGNTHEEIKEKMRAQIKAMDSTIRPTTIRLHFIDDQKQWILAPLPNEETNSNKQTKSQTPKQKKK